MKFFVYQVFKWMLLECRISLLEIYIKISWNAAKKISFFPSQIWPDMNSIISHKNQYLVINTLKKVFSSTYQTEKHVHTPFLFQCGAWNLKCLVGMWAQFCNLYYYYLVGQGILLIARTMQPNTTHCILKRRWVPSNNSHSSIVFNIMIWTSYFEFDHSKHKYSIQ